MATTAERLAALEAAVLPPAPVASPPKPPPAARLVVGDVDTDGRLLPGTKVHTANAGTLEDLCREVGAPAKVVAAAKRASFTEARWSGKEDDTLKAL